MFEFALKILFGKYLLDPFPKKHLIIVLALAKCWFWDDASDGCHGKESKS